MCAAPAAAGVSGALAAVLRADRDQLNARVAEARLIGGGFAEDAFTLALRGPVNTLAATVAEQSTDEVETTVRHVVHAAFDAALTLTARGVELHHDGPGAPTPAARLWQLLPSIAHVVAEDPVAIIGSLTNAALAIQRTPGTDVVEWLRRLELLADQTTGSAGTDSVGAGWQLLAFGRVAAWACGMAHHRDAALDSLTELHPSLQALALAGWAGPAGAAADLTGWDPLDRWSRPADEDTAMRGPHPTAHPAGGHPAGHTPAGDTPGTTGTAGAAAPAGQTALVPGRPAGGFLGLGGPFSVPPSVWLDGDGLPFASAAPEDGVWRVHADVFGSTLTRARRRITPAPPAGTAGRPALTDIPHLASTAATSDTVIWTTAMSFRVQVAGLPR